MFAASISTFMVLGMLFVLTGCPDTKTKTTDTKATVTEKKDNTTTKTTEEKKVEETKKKDT